MVRPFSEIFQNKIDSPLFLVPFFFVFFFIIVTECKKRWSTLRDTYRKSLRSQRTKSGEGAKKKKIWRYDKHMSFLRCFLVDRQQISNVEQCDSSEDETQEREEDSNVTDELAVPAVFQKVLLHPNLAVLPLTHLKHQLIKGQNRQKKHFHQQKCFMII